MSLDDLFLATGTDKSSEGHYYGPVYEQLLVPFRPHGATLLEIGVAGGSSLRAWKAYAPLWRVHGIDDNDDCLEGFHADGLFIGDQRDESFLRRVIREIGKPNIVIDDGGHEASEQRASFEILFPLVAPGGLYVVEDTHVWTQGGYMDSDPPAREFFLALTDDLTFSETDIASMHFFRQLLAIWKK